jgi:hypothetical protein
MNKFKNSLTMVQLQVWETIDMSLTTLRKVVILEEQITMVLFNMPKNQLVSKEAQEHF